MVETTGIDAIRTAIQSATDDLNRTKLPESRIELHDNSILIGDGGSLDSLGLVTFLVSMEEHLFKTTGTQVALLTESNLSLQSPLRSVSLLIAYINESLQQG